jgi:hypothetical protein
MINFNRSVENCADERFRSSRASGRTTTTKFLSLVTAITVFLILSTPVNADESSANETLLVHLKTSLQHDDAQICVAYNMIWAALREGMNVDVLIDADGINTFKKKLFSDSDHIKDYAIPLNLRTAMATQFSLSLDDIPVTYGEFLLTLHEKGAKFHINKAFLIVAGIAENPDRDLGKIARYAASVFKPVLLTEMLELRKTASIYFAF